MKKINAQQSIGLTTLGEKGQVVIPAHIRKALNLKTAEKILVFAKDEGIIILSKVSNLEKISSHLSVVQNFIKKARKIS